MFATAKGIARARSVFSSSKLTVYTDCAVTVPQAATRCYLPPNPADYDAGEQPDYPSTLHAKLYVLERQAGDADAWVGSANFTAQALTRSVSKGGNVECMVHTAIPRDELDALRAELNGLFQKPERTDLAAPRVPELSVPRSTVLACELQRTSTGPRLVVYAVPGTLSVTLEHRGLQVTIKIRGGVGILHGNALHAAFPELNADCPQLFVVHQVIGKVRVPVVVNSPYMSGVADGPSQTSLDNLLDELRGHVPKPQARNEIDTPEDYDSEDDAEAEIDLDMAVSEQRLDEVKHQGMLDQLAVKVAVARRLILRGTEPGLLREELLALARRSCVVACPPALRPILEEWLSR